MMTKFLAIQLVTLAAAIVLILIPPSVLSEEIVFKPPAWITDSNENAMVLGRVLSRFEPESAHDFGILKGFDDQVYDLGPEVERRFREALDGAVRTLDERVKGEHDTHVREDLAILIATAQRHIRESESREKGELPYHDIARIIFNGVDTLLSATQVGSTAALTEPCRLAVLARLRKYAGLEKDGQGPLSVLAEQRTRERFAQAGIAGPYKAKLEHDLARSTSTARESSSLLSNRCQRHLNTTLKAGL